MPKKDKLTVKQAKLVKGIVAGKTKTQAAIEAGYTGAPETARVEAHRTLQKPYVRNALQVALEKAGITPDLIVAPVAEALNHSDLDMKLKGHDRAAKIMQPREGGGVNINFNNIAQDDKKEFGI